MDIKTRIRVALGLEDEVSLAYEGKLADGTIVVSEAEALAEGVAINVLSEDGTQIPVPVGTFTMEDGTSFVVEEEGIIASIGEAELEEVEEEYGDKDKEEMSDEASLEQFAEVVNAIFNEMRNELDTLRAEMNELMGESLAKDENIAELQEENTELAKMVKEAPATSNVNTNKFSKKSVRTELSNTEYNKLTAKQKYLYNFNKNN
tara:strand:+ start:67 stop:681 length:615 start_codon:yes stop_codon:yes gene_type:complete